MARANPGDREMARASCRRVFRLPRRADEQCGDQRVPLPCHSPLAPRPRPAQSEGALGVAARSEEHTSELQSLTNLVCRLLLEKKKKKKYKFLDYKKNIKRIQYE